MGAQDWDGQERRKNTEFEHASLTIVINTLKDIKEIQCKQDSKIDLIHKAIYIGDGRLSIMERLVDMENAKKTLYAFIGLIVTVLVGLIIEIFKKRII